MQDGGCGDIAEALKSNEKLVTLVLAANDLSTSSCYYWIDCLQVRPRSRTSKQKRS